MELPNKRIIQITINHEDQVKVMKKRINEMFDIKIDDMDLVYGGKILQNEKKIKDYRMS